MRLFRRQLSACRILSEGWPVLTRITEHMKPTPDPELRALLRRADPAARDGSDRVPQEIFAAEVRARIDRLAPTQPSHATPRRWQAELNALAACLALFAALAAGGFAAYIRHPAKVTERHAAAYARSIDPVLMHAAHPAR